MDDRLAALVARLRAFENVSPPNGGLSHKETSVLKICASLAKEAADEIDGLNELIGTLSASRAYWREAYHAITNGANMVHGDDFDPINVKQRRAAEGGAMSDDIVARRKCTGRLGKRREKQSAPDDLDIVPLLRALDTMPDTVLYGRAADEIERLREKLERCEEMARHSGFGD